MNDNKDKDLSALVSSPVGSKTTFQSKARTAGRDIIDEAKSNTKDYLKKMAFHAITEFANRIILDGKGPTTSGSNQYWKGLSGNTLSGVAKGVASAITKPNEHPKLNLNDRIEIPVESWANGNCLIDEINEYLNDYGAITVPKLFVLLRQPCDTNNSQLGNYGWTNMSDAAVKHTWEGGYILQLPKAKPLEK